MSHLQKQDIKNTLIVYGLIKNFKRLLCLSYCLWFWLLPTSICTYPTCLAGDKICQLCLPPGSKPENLKAWTILSMWQLILVIFHLALVMLWITRILFSFAGLVSVWCCSTVINWRTVMFVLSSHSTDTFCIKLQFSNLNED